jgi:hypothetical protein
MTFSGNFFLFDSGGACKNNVRLLGENSNDKAGYSVNSIGDLNGDGKPEVIIGALRYLSGGNQGAAYVVSGAKIDFTTGGGITLMPGAGIVKLVGETAGPLPNVGASVSFADLNGDGKPEVIVGATGGNTAPTGATYVIDGSKIDLATGNTILLSDWATAGKGIVRLIGPTGENVGNSVSSISDLNVDGKPELLIGGTGSVPPIPGVVYIVSGSKIDLANGGSITLTPSLGITKLVGENNSDQLGTSVNAIDDLNSDGKPEIIIGAPGYLSGGNRGAAYVVSGAKIDFTVASSITLTPGIGIVRLIGENPNDQVGTSVHSIEDLNVDGKKEILIGAKGYVSNTGATYVVSGGKIDFTVAGSITLTPGLDIVRLVGENPNDQVGTSVSNIGDMDGDGKEELLIGAIGLPMSGGAYVVSGAKIDFTVTSSISLANYAVSNSGIIKLEGLASAESAGASVSAVGDLNSDGKSELIIGAPNTGGGVTYIVPGSNIPGDNSCPIASPSSTASLSPSLSPSPSDSSSSSFSPSPLPSPSVSPSSSTSPSPSFSPSTSILSSQLASPSNSPSKNSNAAPSPINVSNVSLSASLSASPSPSASNSPSNSPSFKDNLHASSNNIVYSSSEMATGSAISSLTTETANTETVAKTKSTHKTFETTNNNDDVSSTTVNVKTSTETNEINERVKFFQQGHGHRLIEVENIQVFNEENVNSNVRFHRVGRDSTNSADDSSSANTVTMSVISPINAAQIPFIQLGIHLMKEGYNKAINWWQGSSKEEQNISQKLLSKEQVLETLNSYVNISNKLENITNELDISTAQDKALVDWLRDSLITHKKESQKLMSQEFISEESFISYYQNIQVLTNDLSKQLGNLNITGLNKLALTYIKSELANTQVELSKTMQGLNLPIENYINNAETIELSNSQEQFINAISVDNDNNYNSMALSGSFSLLAEL